MFSPRRRTRQSSESVSTVELRRQSMFLAFQEPADNGLASIVAVHGLDGDWKRSWSASNGVFWLGDLLPQAIPTARILSFSYDSRTRGSDAPLKNDVSESGKHLLDRLTMYREKTRVRLPCHQVPLHTITADETICARHKSCPSSSSATVWAALSSNRLASRTGMTVLEY